MSEQDKLYRTLILLGERVKWVVLLGGCLFTLLGVGFLYQINTNLANAEIIQTNQQAIQSHIDTVDPMHQALIKHWLINE